MSIDPTLWPKLHGASVHFPLALAASAALFDGLGFVWPKRAASSVTVKARLNSAGYATLVLGALGTFPAVLSGLFMTNGEIMGHDALRMHHLFVWPAFAGMVGLAAWRVSMGDRLSSRGFACYLGVLFAIAALMAGAGYWGGELILNV